VLDAQQRWGHGRPSGTGPGQTRRGRRVLGHAKARDTLDVRQDSV
jgi:hypothetical protein